MSSDTTSFQESALVLPRLRIQNANAISSPMTWGFPAMSAFLGLMHALGRRTRDIGLEFLGVGVICHDYEAQVTEGAFPNAFRLTRNPVDDEGKPAAIVEEGRIHLEVTLVFLTNVSEAHWPAANQQTLADRIGDLIQSMRVAGGSVLPNVSATLTRSSRPQLRILPTMPDERALHFRRMLRPWLPGFALVSRDDLLRKRLVTLRETEPSATALDAWLDLSRWTHRATAAPVHRVGHDAVDERVSWVADRRDGWTVPIPVGYAGISPLYPAGSVANVRDDATPFRFVESAYSIGQWVSPHRMTDVRDFLWYSQYEEATSLYRCCNDYAG